MKMLRTLLAAALATLPLLFAPRAQAHEATYFAQLVDPNNAGSFLGTAYVTLDLDIVTMDVVVNFAGLPGTVTGAHIHAATATPFTGDAIVATTLSEFPTGVISGSYSRLFDLTVASTYDPGFIAASGGTVSNALNALDFAMDDGKAYLDIHTTAFPNGEIRGFLAPVSAPEPGTLALLGLAVVPAVVLRRRRHS
ncbi:MAG: CHRD domain-containing protein [Armatimonas sp.]